MQKHFVHLSITALLLAAFFIIPNDSLAQTKAQKIDALMAKFHEYGQFNGSVLVAENGKVIFKLNVEAFPQSSNVYDSLDEAYLANGDKELAIKNYEKSIELNPQNTNGIEVLKKLKAN